MNAEKILTILVDLYCQQEGVELEEIHIEKKEPQDDETGGTQKNSTA